ncbi:hypothetical protein LMG29660_06044 [Burkholderia puraquae]|uniref:Uncharacterized protein n=1 Tax=Burkholderia puraquae TaxID=1904757 RepID=A0A6J5EQ47_9BURK|nr:hypothetical protein LMG29660_06044 [Burkholderia puraquae]
MLDDGHTLVADTVVAGIGIDPADELARDAGLAVERGIDVSPAAVADAGVKLKSLV